MTQTAHHKIVEVKEFSKSTFEFCEDGIVIIRIKDDVYLELADSMEEHDFLKTKTAYHPLRILVVPGKHMSVSKEVREFATTKEATDIVACQAIVIQALPQRLIASFIMRGNKSTVEFKVFKNESDGIYWLRGQ